MGEFKTSISPVLLDRLVGTDRSPMVFDVRRRAAYDEAGRVIATATWRDHRKAEEWAAGLTPDKDVVVYCVHGHQVSQAAAAVLRGQGLRARYLEGGIEGFEEAGGVTIRKDVLPDRDEGQLSRWVAPENPSVERLACAWLIRRFVAPDAAIHSVSSAFVKEVAAETGATVFAAPGAALSGFAACLESFGISDAALGRLAAIVSAAESERPKPAPQAAGLRAMTLGLATLYPDECALLDRAMALYDGLYAWCRSDGGRGQ